MYPDLANASANCNESFKFFLKAAKLAGESEFTGVSPVDAMVSELLDTAIWRESTY